MANYCRQPPGYGARPSAATVAAQHQQRSRCGGPLNHKVKLNTFGPSALNKPLPPPIHQPAAHATPAAPTQPTVVTPTLAPKSIAIVAPAPTSVQTIQQPPAPPIAAPPPFTKFAEKAAPLPPPDLKREIAELVKAEVSTSIQILHDRVSLVEQRLSMLASRIEHTHELIVGTELASKNARTIMLNEWQENLTNSNSIFQQQLLRRMDALDEQVREVATMAMVVEDMDYSELSGDEEATESGVLLEDYLIANEEKVSESIVQSVAPSTTEQEEEKVSSRTAPPHVHVEDGHVLVFHSAETPFEQGIPAPNSVCQRLVRSADGESSFQTCIMMNNGVWAVIRSLPVTKFIASISMGASELAASPNTTPDAN